jgi:hypothetical protein
MGQFFIACVVEPSPIIGELAHNPVSFPISIVASKIVEAGKME